MADVFVSYKSEDRGRVKPLVAALEADGFSVWWDAQIGAGDKWRETIETNLTAAKCVIVVWSVRSVGLEGHFVRDEATRALRRHAYLPVRIDAVEPPLGFGEVQAMSIEGWKGSRKDARYLSILEGVRALVERRATVAAAAATPAPRKGIDRRMLLAGGGVAALGAAGAATWLLWPSPVQADTSIAILPFSNLSGDPGQAYFVDGLTEELRTALTQIPQLKVFGRTSSEAVRELDPRAAASKLGVGNILTGSVRRSADKVRVTAQLIRGRDGIERWSDTYDRPAGDAIEIQTAIARSVARALQIQLTGLGIDALTLGGTHNAEAHDLVLQSMTAKPLDSPVADLRQTLAVVDKALALDPRFGRAWAARAYILMSLSDYEASPATAAAMLQQAKAAAQRSLDVAPGMPVGYAVLGTILSWQLDLAGARKALTQALAGNDPVAMSAAARFLAAIGEAQPAQDAIARAIQLDPLNIQPEAARVDILYRCGRFDEALKAARAVLAIEPDMDWGNQLLGDVLLQLGKPRDALAAYRRSSEEGAGPPARFAIVQWLIGDHAESDTLYARYRATAGDTAHYQYAQIEAQRGHKDAALGELERAWQFRDPGLKYLRTDPLFAALRGEQRFTAVLAKLGLPG
ncbi:TIR domain-containing protein [Sphingomonas sp.]|uniref:TIR domain-containing protein n=1 Tax=Sphingomonas sp. TaxID=28214 RepID=UPI001B0C7061|nr:TIR domain-containing protein [Sphingomonas sp.]MBO9715141.1 TIR domain-containing protein [Sphingomonas sp.]